MLTNFPDVGAKIAVEDCRGGRRVCIETAHCSREPGTGSRTGSTIKSRLRAPGEAGAIQPVERVGGPVASVAGPSATTKRTQRDDEDCLELRKFLPCEALRTAAGNMCGTIRRGPSLRRSPVRAVKDHVGTWETSGRPQPPWRSRAGSGRRGRSRSRTGRSEELRVCRIVAVSRPTDVPRFQRRPTRFRRYRPPHTGMCVLTGRAEREIVPVYRPTGSGAASGRHRRRRWRSG